MSLPPPTVLIDETELRQLAQDVLQGRAAPSDPPTRAAGEIAPCQPEYTPQAIRFRVTDCFTWSGPETRGVGCGV